jgi:hypothetical protein
MLRTRIFNLNGLKAAALSSLLALMAACGAGGDAGSGAVAPAACTDCGTALLSITDAPGDFLSYTVDVTSLQLRKANGALVQTLPVSTRIDFTELVDLNEVLSAGQIPAGEYVAAQLRVDYSSAQILVEDELGGSVPVTPVNANGQALGVVDLEIDLDNRKRLRINAGQIAHLAFDLNLAASNAVDLSARQVTVSPFVVASVVPPERFQTRVRGRLASVDVAAGSYTVDIRPARNVSRDLGSMVVHTTGSTAFEINGLTFTGAAGLAQLAALAVPPTADNPMVIAFGAVQTSDHSFTARRVLAGTSIEDARRDRLSGNVLSRSGNTLVVGGVRLHHRDGRWGFERGPVTVTIGTATRVTRAGQGGGTFGIGDISVGQRVDVFGEAAGNPSTGITLDATAGAVRLEYTHLAGTVADRGPGSLALSLLAIDGRNPARFDFAGTGASAMLDADPAHYEVDSGILDTTGLTAGNYARVMGFVTPFGVAPPDFRADTLVDLSALRAHLELGWGVQGSTDPFTVLTSTSLTVDLADPLPRGVIHIAGRVVEVSSLGAGLVIVPAESGDTLYAIRYRRGNRIVNFSAFADFSAALAGALNGNITVVKMHAAGEFAASAGPFTARQILVMVND